MLSTERPGIEKLIEHIAALGFFTQPASTKYHGCYKGGLASHSLGVYNLVNQHSKEMMLDEAVTPGQKPLKVSQGNIIIACLLHDVCKAGAYLGDKAPYKWNRNHPKGHALLSLEIVKKFIELEKIEELMIMYHMGVYGLNEFYDEDDWQTGEYPLRGDHSNDEDMTREESKEARYGKSLANAWYHNPIVKLMYFCDEIATLREKAAMLIS